MSDIHTTDWSTTAASNNATPPNGWPENMDFSKVNDSARENMAALKRWYNDISAVNTSAGSSNAYTLAADRTIASYAAGQVFCFIADRANTGAATLNVDSVGAKSIKKHHDVDLAPNDIEASQIVVVAYKATEDVFQLLSPTAAEHYRNVNTLTAAPGVGDDTADGYQPGSLAVDVTNDRAYVCVDASAGAAVWKKISGGVIQRVEATPYTTYATTTSEIPSDDTIPQSTEGTEYITVSITPTKSANRLVIEAAGMIGADSAINGVVAMFQDSTANALTATQIGFPGASYVYPFSLRHEMEAGTTSATTFKIRIGRGGASGSISVNGSSAARRFGGVAALRLSVIEVEA